MARASKTQIEGRAGKITHQQHESDSPILPISQLELLHSYRPDLVDWVVKETTVQAEHRRKEERRVNSFIFTESIVAQILTTLIALASIGCAVFSIIKGQPWVGGIILSATAAALVFAIRAINKKE